MTQPQKPTTIAKLLAGYGIRASKQLGQHFLVDTRHLVKLLQIKELSDVETLLEVGPGPGNLTELLVDTGKPVIAVELDRRFIRLLNDRFTDLTLIHADVLQRGRLNPAVTSVLERSWGKPWAIVANLPYQVATAVILEALHLPHRPHVMCVTVQKAVAQRLRASPGRKAFSALSVLAQSYATVELVSTVPAGSFWPRPNVDSAIVKLIAKPRPGIHDGAALRDLVNAMFRSRRKTLKTGFVQALPREQQPIVNEALSGLGLEPALRAEQLDVDCFIQLSNVLTNRRCRPKPKQ